MKYVFSIKDISTYRAELMGWSILWIMMLHFTFTQIQPLGFIAQYGFAGVDVFMLVSGFGLYHSLEKNDNILYFYGKRLLRIFPTYYLIGIFHSLLISHDSFLTYLYRYTTLGFWTNGIYWGWYIPSLIVLYLFAPIFKKMFTGNLFPVLGTFMACCWILAYILIDREDIIDRSHFFLLYRIPAFIFGMVCAYWVKKRASPRYFLYILLAGIPLFAILFPHHHQVYNYKYFSLAFLLPFFTLVFLLISKHIIFINPIISVIGKASLEIYLIQGLFFTAILRGLLQINPAWHDMTTILLIIVSTIMGIIVHWLIDKIGILRLL